jgi:hypothetical protein
MRVDYPGKRQFERKNVAILYVQSGERGIRLCFLIFSPCPLSIFFKGLKGPSTSTVDCSDEEVTFCMNSEAHRRNISIRSIGEESCLGILLRAQTVDQLGIGNIYDYFQDLLVHENGDVDRLYQKLLGEDNFKDWFEDIERDCSEKYAAIRKYLFSASARDCSVMLTFWRDWTRSDQNHVLTQTKMIDLDPKPLNRIPLYLSQDVEIRKMFEQRIKEI